MMGWSSRCYIPSFVEIGPTVLKKIFKGFSPYMGVVAILVMWVFTIYKRGGHLVHVTSIMSSNFHFLVPGSFLTEFGSELHSSF